MSKPKQPWRPMRSAPRDGVVTLLGTTDAARDKYMELEGEWDEELKIFCTKAGWCIAAVAWREDND